MRDGVAPLRKLGMQVVEIAEGPGGKEGVAQILDLALDFALGESRRLRSMRMIRIDSSASPIRSTH